MSLKLLEVSLANLEKLDGGRAAETFAHHCRRTAMDCEDRPGESKPRKVVMEMILVPVQDPVSGACEEVRSQFVIKSLIPTHRTKAYTFGVRRGGKLVFNEDFPDSPDQTSLLPVDDDDTPALPNPEG